MAKDKSKDKAEGYGVEAMAKFLGVQPATARVILRNNKVKKDGRSYNWKSKGELERVGKSLRTEAAPAKKVKPDKAKAKPAKAKKAKAAPAGDRDAA